MGKVIFFTLFSGLSFSALIGSQALAGAYGLECTNNDGSIVINRGEIAFKKDNGEKMEGVYFRIDGVDLMTDFGTEIRSFLGDPRAKFIIEPDLDKVGNRSEAKVLSHKDIRDECGHRGEKSVTRQDIRIYDATGSDTVLKKGTVYCTASFVIGHCD